MLVVTDIEIERVSGRHIHGREQAVVPAQVEPGGERVRRCMCLFAPCQVNLRRDEILEGRIEQADIGVQARPSPRPAQFDSSLQAMLSPSAALSVKKTNVVGSPGTNWNRAAYLLVLVLIDERSDIEPQCAIQCGRS